MEKWKEYKLKDICTKITDGSHSSPKAQDSGFPMFSVKDMLEYDFNFSKCKLISNEDFETLQKNGCVPEKGDVLVAKDGSYLKQIFVCKEKRNIGVLSSIAIFRPNPKYVLPYFLTYLLKSPKVFNYIASNCVSGSALPRIVLKDFKEINLIIPSIETQKRILGYLKPLDDKIQINNKINENLEQQAQALFKSWFVDFEPFKDGKFVDSELGMIPEGWEIGMLKDISNIVMGQSPKGKSLNELGEGIVFYQGRTEFGERFPSIRQYTTEPKKYAEPFSVLLSVRAPVGDINITPYKCCIGRGIASLMAKNNNKSFLYYYLKYLNRVFDRYNGEGTVFGCINKKALEEIKIIIPKASIIKDYEQITEAMDNIILNNFLENERLSSIRDTLLPKLMSGEIELK